MYNKILKYLVVLLFVISVVLIGYFYIAGFSEETLATTVPMVINWALFLLIAAALAAVVLPIFFSSGKGGKKSLISLGVIVVLCVLSYVCASDSIPEYLADRTNASTMKLTDAGLIMTCILIAVAVLSIIGGSVLNMLKNK